MTRDTSQAYPKTQLCKNIYIKPIWGVRDIDKNVSIKAPDLRLSYIAFRAARRKEILSDLQGNMSDLYILYI